MIVPSTSPRASAGRGALAAAHLSDALERAAAALASPNLEALLACEAEIETALAALPPVTTFVPEERPAVRAELERARAALRRCRRLGAALNEFVRLSFEAQGRTHGYGRQVPAYAARALNARV
jgi:hypothetical protein